MFRLMFCVLIALLLPACDQGGPQEANQTPAAPSPEAPEASATNDTETLKPAEGIPAPAAGLTGPGRLVFEETTADFGRLTENEERTRRLSFRNAGAPPCALLTSKGRADARSPKCQSGSGALVKKAS